MEKLFTAEDLLNTKLIYKVVDDCESPLPLVDTTELQIKSLFGYAKAMGYDWGGKNFIYEIPERTDKRIVSLHFMQMLHNGYVQNRRGHWDLNTKVSKTQFINRLVYKTKLQFNKKKGGIVVLDHQVRLVIRG